MTNILFGGFLWYPGTLMISNKYELHYTYSWLPSLQKVRCIQGKIYVVGGSADGRTLNTFEVQRAASEVNFKWDDD